VLKNLFMQIRILPYDLLMSGTENKLTCIPQNRPPLPQIRPPAHPMPRHHSTLGSNLGIERHAEGCEVVSEINTKPFMSPTTRALKGCPAPRNADHPRFERGETKPTLRTNRMQAQKKSIELGLGPKRSVEREGSDDLPRNSHAGPSSYTSIHSK